MDYSGFYIYCQDRGHSQANITSFVNKLENCFNDDCFSDREGIKKLFFYKDKIVRDKQFYKIKKYAILFYEYLILQGTATLDDLSFVEGVKLSELTNEWDPAEYFRDLNDVLSFISAAGDYFGLSANEDLHLIKSVAILFWHGVGYREIIDIKKADVDCGAKTIRVGESLLTIHSNYFNHFYCTLAANEYRSLPNGTWVKYAPSEYLFRTYKSSKLSEGALRRLINYYNNYFFEFSRKKISRTALQDCGIFFKMRNKGGEHEPILRSYEDFQPDAKTKYKILYLKWERTFFQKSGDTI